MGKPYTHYVAYCFVRYQDGSEEWAKVFSGPAGLRDAVAWLERAKGADGPNRHNVTVHLFGLNEADRIPLVEEDVTEPAPPPPPRTYTRVRLAGQEG